MGKLHKLQQDFAQAVFSGNNETIAPTIAPGKASSTELMKIYQRNSAAGLTTVLKAHFPVVEKLVGEKFFSATAKAFLTKNPPQSGNLEDYGADFASFLETFPPAQQLPYLSDVARFEWAYHACELADKPQEKAGADFQALSPEALLETAVQLHPSCQFFTSPYPILRIWQMDENSSDEIDLDEGGITLLLARPAREVLFMPLEDEETPFIQSLLAGKTLYAAYEAALEINDNFNFAFYLQKHLESGTFTAIT